MSNKPHELSPEVQVNLNHRLIDAALNGYTDTVQTLLAAGANVHAYVDSALRLATFYGYTDTVQALLLAGADVHVQNDHVLRCAARNGYTETVKALLEAGACVGVRRDNALSLATERGHTETAKILEAQVAVEQAQSSRPATSSSMPGIPSPS